MHSVHFHGQILTTENHHTDTVSLFPGSSTTVEMVADNPGHWLLTCTVNDHLTGELTVHTDHDSWIQDRYFVPSLDTRLISFVCVCCGLIPAGMQAIFEIKKCFPNVHKPRPHGELRQYFIAAEEEVWDYAPTPPMDGFVMAQNIYIYINCIYVYYIHRNVLSLFGFHRKMFFLHSSVQRSGHVFNQRSKPHW